MRLWQSSGRPAESIAQEVGVKADDLYRWKRVSQSARAAGPTGSPVGQPALEAEVTRLRQEVLRLTEQRDILKKAAGILCELLPRGMISAKPTGQLLANQHGHRAEKFGKLSVERGEFASVKGCHGRQVTVRDRAMRKGVGSGFGKFAV